MSDIPVPVWSAVIGLVGAVVGVSIGAVLQRRFESKHWERTTRLKVYSEFLRASDEFRHRLREEEPEQALRAQAAASKAWSEVVLVGGEETVETSKKVLQLLNLLHGVISVAAEKGDTLVIESNDLSDTVEERWEYITAARKHLGMKPAELTRPTVLSFWDADPDDEDDVADEA